MLNMIGFVYNKATKILKKVAIMPIRGYQLFISPLFGPKCRYQPTCSNYMIQAIIEWGAFKGVWLGLKRIGRCHPWGSHGYDPVPTKKDLEGMDVKKATKK